MKRLIATVIVAAVLSATLALSGGIPVFDGTANLNMIQQLLRQLDQIQEQAYHGRLLRESQPWHSRFLPSRPNLPTTLGRLPDGLASIDVAPTTDFINRVQAVAGRYEMLGAGDFGPFSASAGALIQDDLRKAVLAQLAFAGKAYETGGRYDAANDGLRTSIGATFGPKDGINHLDRQVNHATDVMLETLRLQSFQAFREATQAAKQLGAEYQQRQWASFEVKPFRLPER